MRPRPPFGKPAAGPPAPGAPPARPAPFAKPAAEAPERPTEPAERAREVVSKEKRIRDGASEIEKKIFEVVSKAHEDVKGIETAVYQSLDELGDFVETITRDVTSRISDKEKSGALSSMAYGMLETEYKKILSENIKRVQQHFCTSLREFIRKLDELLTSGFDELMRVRRSRPTVKTTKKKRTREEPKKEEEKIEEPKEEEKEKAKEATIEELVEEKEEPKEEEKKEKPKEEEKKEELKEEEKKEEPKEEEKKPVKPKSPPLPKFRGKPKPK